MFTFFRKAERRTCDTCTYRGTHDMYPTRMWLCGFILPLRGSNSPVCLEGRRLARNTKEIIQFPSDKQKTAINPVQKPVALLEYLINLYSREGDTVLDNCMGSASTGVACLNTRRKFVGIDKSRYYFRESCMRLEEAYV